MAVRGKRPAVHSGCKDRCGEPVTFALAHLNLNFEKLGNYPSPRAYGLFWIGGYASATFMTAAAKLGIKIYTIHGYGANLDYHAQFQLGTQTMVGAYRVTFNVTSEQATDEEIESLKQAAYNKRMHGTVYRENCDPVNCFCKESMTLPSYFSITDHLDCAALKAEAEELFTSGQFYCSKAVVNIIIDMFCQSVSYEIIASASGFPVWMGRRQMYVRGGCGRSYGSWPCVRKYPDWG